MRGSSYKCLRLRKLNRKWWFFAVSLPACLSMLAIANNPKKDVAGKGARLKTRQSWEWTKPKQMLSRFLAPFFSWPRPFERGWGREGRMKVPGCHGIKTACFLFAVGLISETGTRSRIEIKWNIVGENLSARA